MVVGTYEDGRAVNFDRERVAFDIGGAAVSLQDMVAYDRAKQVSWSDVSVRDWLISQAGVSSAGAKSAAPNAKRYQDAYVVAAGLVGLGKTVKGLAIALGVVCFLAGSAVLANMTMGGVGGLAGIVLGFAVGLPVYLLGVLVSAAGQLLRASIDTAVHTSPLLSPEQVAQLTA